MSILFTRRPLVVNVSLAELVGLNPAIVLQQLHYWLTEGRGGVEHEGRRWIYNTMGQWQEQFPFWSIDTIRRSFSALRQADLILVEQLAKHRHDRTNYYAIRYEHPALVDEGRMHPSDGGRLPSSTGAGCNALPETTAETTAETTKRQELSLSDLMADNPNRLSEQAISDWLVCRQRLRAPVTQTGWAQLNAELRQCAAAGIPAADALATAVAAGWRGFRAEWLLGRVSTGPTAGPDFNDTSWADGMGDL